MNWELLHNHDSVDDVFNQFTNKITSLYDEYCPIKKVKIRSKLNSPPWLTRSLVKACRKKNRLYKNHIMNKNIITEGKYKKYKNKLTSILRYCEKQYYDDLFAEYSSNIKKTWSVLNSIIKNKKGDSNVNEKFIGSNGEIMVNKGEIANSFNNFFVEVGPKLAATIKQENNDVNILDFMGDAKINSMFLEGVVEQEIIDIVNNCNNKTSCDYFGISMALLKKIITCIAKPFTYICNRSFSEGIFPEQMKTAKVIPLFKSGEKSYFTNYRPVSLLPQFSKVLEKLFCSRFTKFIERNEILTDNQYGFRSKHSTSLALIDLLEHYGIRGVAHNWLSSYISNRKQFVSYNDTVSDMLKITCGVPQGSILGPLLFILYINDLCNVSKFLKCALFADDTNLFASGNNINTLCEQINDELSKINKWFNINKLSLNLSKTNFIIFSKKKNK